MLRALTVSWNYHIYVRLPISILILKEREISCLI